MRSKVSKSYQLSLRKCERQILGTDLKPGDIIEFDIIKVFNPNGEIKYSREVEE